VPDEDLIEQARQVARAQRKTLNAAFREWLLQFTAQSRWLRHVNAGRRFTRDEMNERQVLPRYQPIRLFLRPQFCRQEPACGAAHPASGGYPQGHLQLPGRAGILQSGSASICAAHDGGGGRALPCCCLPSLAGSPVNTGADFRSTALNSQAPALVVRRTHCGRRDRRRLRHSLQRGAAAWAGSQL